MVPTLGLPIVFALRETVTTDIFPSGWGAVWQSSTAHGRWPVEDWSAHIHVLQLHAVHLAEALLAKPEGEAHPCASQTTH